MVQFAAMHALFVLGELLLQLRHDFAHLLEAGKTNRDDVRIKGWQ